MEGLLRPCRTQKPEEPDNSAQLIGSSIRSGQTCSVFGLDLRTTKEENNHRCLFNSEQLRIFLARHAETGIPGSLFVLDLILSNRRRRDIHGSFNETSLAGDSPSSE